MFGLGGVERSWLLAREAGEDLRGGRWRQREALPSALRLLIEAALGLTHREPEIARLVDETFEDLEGGFRAAIERGQAAAEIAERVDPETTARVLLNLYVGLFPITGHDAAGERLGAVLQQVEALLPAPART